MNNRFDENEIVSLNEKIQNLETIRQQATQSKLTHDQNSKENFHATEYLRHRKVEENSFNFK